MTRRLLVALLATVSGVVSPGAINAQAASPPAATAELTTGGTVAVRAGNSFSATYTFHPAATPCPAVTVVVTWDRLQLGQRPLSPSTCTAVGTYYVPASGADPGFHQLCGAWSDGSYPACITVGSPAPPTPIPTPAPTPVATPTPTPTPSPTTAPSPSPSPSPTLEPSPTPPAVVVTADPSPPADGSRSGGGGAGTRAPCPGVVCLVVAANSPSGLAVAGALAVLALGLVAVCTSWLLGFRRRRRRRHPVDPFTQIT